MPEERGDSSTWPTPTNREELIKYLESVVTLTESQDTTAGFLLRLVVSTLNAEPPS
jgi:hypothetical protein